MWCPSCQEDVPVAASGDAGQYACSRCGGRVVPGEGGCGGDSPGEATRADGPDGGAGGFGGPAWEYDAWEWDEGLRQIERALSAEGGSQPSGGRQPGLVGRQVRVDQAHGGSGHRHRPPGRRSRRGRRRGGQRGTLVATTALSLGIMTLACGGVLMVWSVVGGRPGLWTLGTPIALAGQILLLVGFIFQVDRLGHDHRRTAAKLADMDQRLEELRTSTSLLATTHSPPATSFYAHMASGASPQMLLADLKSQLDLLAVKLASHSPGRAAGAVS